MCRCCPHLKTSQVICCANQLTGFYMRGTLALNGLKNHLQCISFEIQTQLRNFKKSVTEVLKVSLSCPCLEQSTIEYNIPVYSYYRRPKCWKFEQNIVNSVKIATFIGLRHVAKLSNTISCNVQSVYPVISNTPVK